ncbi:hypothetical protein CLV45_3809 [Hymenobacter chitinivorans DSM 11115]|uniref:Uncharacterized protein n=1 Tax=Hymenobacter chitinivorans DSM 11115 TaxID=1121954 RepID=A0A2M9B5D6_9BACT|nr:hypothetical protein CLV45_3809 [Hymenobacter chitinivorans DSM 11115]
MATTNTPVSAKMKWNRSQLIETNTYIKVYTEALNRILPAHDRQTLFIVSKLFADGAAESGGRRLHLARHLFERGEKYVAAIPAEKPVLKLFLSNIYDRSKSFYHYRTGNPTEAIQLVHNALVNNITLEANGFEFLVFDRVSQYHNLAKVYFGLQQPERGFEILSDSICFLMTGRARVLTDLNRNYLGVYNADLIQMRYSLLALILCETLTNLQKGTDAESFVRDSEAFMTPILAAAPEFVLHEPQEEFLQQWLLVVQLFYQRQYSRFREAAAAFLATAPSCLRNVPHELLESLVGYSRELSAPLLAAG